MTQSKTGLNHSTDNLLDQTAALIADSRCFVAFTGAGISVESGIPPFRGHGGLWNKVDPRLLEIGYFEKNPLQSWRLIKQLFYQTLKKAKPNAAHHGLARLEKAGYLKTIITQNIDYLHQQAGSARVLEYHGTYKYLKCLQCGYRTEAKESMLVELPPLCPRCRGVLKPDFVFFGEAIPQKVAMESEKEARKADLMLIIGSTGEVYPAAMIPETAFHHGSKIVEINIEPSNYTHSITHIFLRGRATEIVSKIIERLKI